MSSTAATDVRARARQQRPEGTFRLPTEIFLGEGAVARVPEALAELGATDPFVVTDPGIRDAGIIDDVLELLGLTSDSAVFDAVESDPTLETVTLLSQRAQEGYDCLVAVGGGSVMDATKAAAALATHPDLTIRDLLGPDRLEVDPLPVVAIPTTAGTGSEVTRFAVLSDHDNHTKASVASFRIMPRYAVLDPELTGGLPPDLTATTGLDALAHAVESYQSIRAYPITEGHALQAVELVGKHLRAAVHESTPEARYGMLVASCIAELAANTTRLGLTHALAVPLGATHAIPHGSAVGLILPHMCAFNRPAAPERDARLAWHLDGEADTLAEAVHRLAEDVGVNEGLGSWGVKPADFERVAGMAQSSDNVAVNPREAGMPELVALLEQAS